jgi:hypothetical protein
MTDVRTLAMQWTDIARWHTNSISDFNILILIKLSDCSGTSRQMDIYASSHKLQKIKIFKTFS